MDSLNQFFIEYGYLGMAMASFLAGTFVPFSSEVVMGTLLATTGMDPVLTILSGTIGNVLGSMFNYFIGRIGSIEQISKWMRIKERRLRKTRDYVEKRGSWIAAFSFLPIFGTAISISLGILRANVWGVALWSFIGKLLRYIIFMLPIVALKT
ncbi:MAG: DedA family protein [Bacteroidaceae bacterium]|nr:DedA family protein [Bacteroidaceae bacterium]